VKVLMTADTVGGVWTYSVELARALASSGVEVALATMGGPPSELQRERVARIPGLKLFESTFRLEWMDEPWDDVERAGRWLTGLAERVEPDVVHLNGYAHGDLDWGRPVVVVGHSCVSSWWQAVHGTAPPADPWARYAERVRAGLAAADRVVAPTAAMLAALEEHYGPLPPARVIANGRDPAAFPPRPKEPFVFSAGRLWDPAKNLAALEAAAPQVPWPIYVAGEARRPNGAAGGETVIRHTHPLGRLSGRVLAAWLGRASIYALPARYEPFGLSALEAAMAGCCLVLGDLPSLREVWGEAATWVDPGDPAALGRELTRLAGDAEARATGAAAARRRAADLTAARMAEGYLALYRELAPSDREPATAAGAFRRHGEAERPAPGSHLAPVAAPR
jgi:glycogen synthase